jgi:hypothetical protein
MSKSNKLMELMELMESKSLNHLIHLNNLTDFVSELKKNENKIVKYHGYDIKIEHYKGNIYMSFITEGEECIGVDYYSNGVLTLGNYYFNTPSNCLRIPNDWFFNEFLKPLGIALKAKRIILNDASSKTFDSCTVPMIFFALTGKQTFYNRYGFVNKRFDRYVEKLKRKKLRGIIDKDIRANSLTLSPGKALPLALTRRLIDSKFLDMPLPEVAQFVIDTCKSKTTPTKSISLVNDIIQFFKKKIIIENQFEHVLEVSNSASRSKSRSGSRERKHHHHHHKHRSHSHERDDRDRDEKEIQRRADRKDPAGAGNEWEGS